MGPHNHFTRDIKPEGECPGCDSYRVVAPVVWPQWDGDTMSEPFHLYFDAAGHLHLAGRKGWREPICPECDEPIRWVLDMASFTSGSDHVMAHARCVWRKWAFTEERKRAVPDL